MVVMTAILDFHSEQFKVFLIYKSPPRFLPSFKSFELSVLEKMRKIDFQDGGHGSHLGFQIGINFSYLLIYKLAC